MAAKPGDEPIKIGVVGGSITHQVRHQARRALHPGRGPALACPALAADTASRAAACAAPAALPPASSR
jgi:hypothetical protein